VRLLFLLLLAANVALFAWTRFLSSADPAVDRQPMARQVEPQKLRIVNERAPGKPEPAPARPKPAAEAPRASAPAACVEWGSFSPADASRAAQALGALALGARLAQYRGEESARWWVHFPPQGSRANALKKAAEVRKLGITEFFIVQEPGPTQWALSLGIFTTEEAAQAYLMSCAGRACAPRPSASAKPGSRKCGSRYATSTRRCRRAWTPWRRSTKAPRCTSARRAAERPPR
jgi:hypothetical protein